MKPADIKRLRTLINLAAKFADALADAQTRGIVGDWSAHGSLKDATNEFHDLQCVRLGQAESDVTDLKGDKQ